MYTNMELGYIYIYICIYTYFQYMYLYIHVYPIYIIYHMVHRRILSLRDSEIGCDAFVCLRLSE